MAFTFRVTFFDSFSISIFFQLINYFKNVYIEEEKISFYAIFFRKKTLQMSFVSLQGKLGSLNYLKNRYFANERFGNLAWVKFLSLSSFFFSFFLFI